MDRPLIGVTTYQERARWGVWDMPASLVPAGYPRLVQEAGGLAVLLPPDDPCRAAGTLDRLDGLVVAGGADVEPGRYGASTDPRTGPADAVRDDWELALVRAALDTGTPVLGICRGMQLLNVCLGGTLTQHLDGHSGGPGRFADHLVTPVPGTRYAALVPEPMAVPAHHHQCLDRIGDGLLASAHAEDGTVEAVEFPGTDRVLGVQWHPEAGEDLRVMAGLVRAARGEERAEERAEGRGALHRPA